jgi:alpha-galactosidase
MQKRTKKSLKGSERLLPITSKQKWNLYFELERRVIDSVRTYLDQRSIKYFLIHDGWTCDREIDKEELRDFVRENTGFDLSFEYTKITNIQLYPSVLQVAKATQT